MHALKDLTIGVILTRLAHPKDWKCLSRSKAWEDLDIALSSASTLQRVLIQFNQRFPIRRPTSKEEISQIRATLQKSMHVSHARGIVVFRFTTGDRAVTTKRNMMTDAAKMD